MDQFLAVILANKLDIYLGTIQILRNHWTGRVGGFRK